MAYGKFQRQVVDEEGEPRTNVWCEVTKSSDGLPPSAVYTDRDGASPWAANPRLFADGYVEFFAAGDAYDVRVYGDGFDETFEYIAVGTAQELDADEIVLDTDVLEQITIQAADRTGSDVNTAQAVFDSAQDVITLLANKTYEFEAQYHITRAAGTTSHTTGVLFAVGGGGSLTAIDYIAQISNPTGNVLSAVSQIAATAETEVVLTAANTSATENLLIKLRGTIRMNVAGTITPQFKYSAAPGGAPTIKRDSFFRCWPIGNGSVVTAGGGIA